MNKSKGVFCLEISDWFGSMKKKNTVEPVLELLHHSPLEVPYIHRDVATKEELNFYLKKWTLAEYKCYPILFLAFHGAPGEIFLAQNNKVMSIDELLKILEGRCHRKIIHFGACSVFNLQGKILKRILTRFNALAISGYSAEVDWVTSSVFEMLFLAELQKNALTKSGVIAVKKRIKEIAPKLSKKLGFKMLVKE
ncbi:MAG: hypothetical protein N2445_02765 [Acidobacteria bacterium]|nr:hypothetical protein [Acidobacteriota bacterium]